MQLEAKEVAKRTLATGGQTSKDFVVKDALVVADRQRYGVDVGDTLRLPQA